MTLQAALSNERLTKYLTWSQSDLQQAVELYTLNLQISETLHVSLHTVEIVLRNAIHDRMTALYGNRWFSDPALIINRYQQEQVANAERKFRGQGSPGQIVAELTFGFWTSLFAKNTHHLWGQDLRPIFDAGRPLQRKEISRRLNDIRSLRNRTAHHEPVIHRDLEAEYTEIREIIGWLSTDALHWCDQICRFSSVHPGVQIIVGNLRNPAL